MCFFSATLHSPEITSLAARVCQHPTWVDLKVLCVAAVCNRRHVLRTCQPLERCVLSGRVTCHVHVFVVAVLVSLQGKDSVPETVRHLVIQVDPSANDEWLTDTEVCDFGA